MTAERTMPAWAACIVRNFRAAAQIPDTITDAQVYTAWDEWGDMEDDDVCALMRQRFGLPPL